MALYGHGVNYAKSIDPSSTNIMDQGLFYGKVRVFQDSAVITAATNLTSTNYIIVGGKLPRDSQVVKIILTCSSPALTTNAAIVVGDEGSTNRYIAATTVTGNDIVVGPTAAGGMYYSVTGTTDNYIRIAGSSNHDCITSGTIKVSIFYVAE